jgi:CRP-like cAMP-binding protein
MGRTLNWLQVTSSMFTDLSDEEQKRAAALLEDCSTQTMRPGGVRSAASFDDTTFLFVEEGVALVETLSSRPNRPIVVSLAGSGTPLLPPARTERLIALTDLSLKTITRPTLDRLLRIPGVAAVVVERLAEQLRESRESLSLEGEVHHLERVRAKLLQLARSHGKVGGDGVRLDLPLTHDLLAQMVGSSRATVTRSLADLQGEGFLRRDGRSLVLIIQPENLA